MLRANVQIVLELASHCEEFFYDEATWPFIIDKLRSTDQNILFKLTTIPIVSLVDRIKKTSFSIGAKENEDYKIIRIWTYNEREAKRWSQFCETLVNGKLQRKFGTNVSADYLFGSEDIDRNLLATFPTSNKTSDSYEKGSLLWNLFKEYALIDSSFRIFLKGNDINPNNPVPTKEGQKDAIFRKIKPIVAYRYQFRTATRIRSRKNPNLFYGLPYIYHMCEGNPRSVIGVIDEFMSNVEIATDNTVKRFTLPRQSSIIKDISERHLHLIETNPDSFSMHFGRVLNLGKIITFIGDYFKQRFLYDDFSMDPVCCFTVDKNVDSKIVELLEIALHYGAIIYIKPKDGVSIDGIIGKKFRLSYLLHPYFSLPKIEYKAINLSSILSKKGDSTLNQILLFNED